MTTRTKLGVAVTTIWLLLAGGLAWSRHLVWCQMTLNEWGDFFAGVVAPVAFLWLILGYVQQGEEVRSNTETLHLQQKALQEQVEGTAALVRNAEAQTKATVARLELEQSKWERLLTKEKASIQPIFVFQGGQGGGASFRMQFKNEGGRARSLTVRSVAPPQGRVEIQPSDYIGEDGNGTIGVDGITTFPTKLEIGYLDAEGNEGIMRLEIYSAGAFRLI